MEQFSNFTYIKQIDLDTFGSKFNMSHRIKLLLEEQIDLAKYGKAIQFISFSPLIGEVFEPKSTYDPSRKKLSLQYYMYPDQAIAADEEKFFRLMLEGFIKAMEPMELPDDFDLDSLKKDLQSLPFEQLREAV